MSSYYLGGDSPETISSLMLGVTEKIELAMTQYYQRHGWTGSLRYEVNQAGNAWWHPTTILAVHDIGSPDLTDISVAGIKRYPLPYIGETIFHAGILKETRSGGTIRGFGGASKLFAKYFDFSIIHDGYDNHLILGSSYKGFRVSLIAYEMEHFSAGLSFQFKF